MTTNTHLTPSDFLALTQRVVSLKEAVLTIDVSQTNLQNMTEIEQACQRLKSVIFFVKGQFQSETEVSWLTMKQRLMHQGIKISGI